MKTCSECKQLLDESQFYSRGSKRGDSQTYCKTCFNKKSIERWRRLKSEAVAAMGGCCHDCKGVYPDGVYEFHHLDPNTKEMSWSKMRLASASKRKEELDKCVMLCANCHRIRHLSS